MDDFELTIYHLHMNEGKIDSLDYQFGCQSRSQDQQKQVAYLMLKLNDNQEEFLSDNESSNSSDSLRSSSSINNSSNNFVGGIIYCNWMNSAEKFKNDFILSFKQSIYYSIGDYLNAFKSTMDFFSYYISSLDHINLTSSQLWQGYDVRKQTKISANFILKLDDKIYLSKPISDYCSLQNIWGIKEKGQNEYRVFNQFTDIQNETNQYYELSKSTVSNLDDIILSDSSTKFESIVSDVKNKYPSIRFDYLFWFNMHFLKIQNFNID